MIELQLLDYLSISKLVFQTGFDQIKHALLHICRECVVVHFLVQEILMLLELLLLCQLLERF